MATSTSLRQRGRNNSRRTSSSSSDNAAVNSDTTVAPSTSRFSVKTAVIVCSQIIVKFIAPPVIGVLCAATVANDRAVIPLYAVTVVSMLFILFVTFLSVIRTNDKTLLRIPNIYNADGTVTQQDSITVFEHDNRFATHYATELPAFALATAWFYLWTTYRFVIVVYAVYLVYRLMTHPLFAVHVWNSVGNSEVERPFGTSPLFQHDKGPVVVIEGKDAFESALNNAAPETLVVVDASVTWCNPCRKMAPEFEKLAAEFKDSVFLSVDMAVSRDIAALLNITTVPTFFLYKNRQQVTSIRGASLASLRSAIETNV